MLCDQVSIVYFLWFISAGAEQSCVDSMSFDTLVPKSILQRYVSLLMDHRRIILCGSSGTGKTYLARRFAEHLIIRLVLVLRCCRIFLGDYDHASWLVCWFIGLPNFSIKLTGQGQSSRSKPLGSKSSNDRPNRSAVI